MCVSWKAIGNTPKKNPDKIFSTDESAKNWMDTFTGSLILVLASMLRLFSLMLVIYALLSWIIRDGHHPVFRFLQSMVEPVLAPIRKVLPPIGGFDI